MAKKIKMRAKMKKGATEVKALMTHPMETGGRKNKKTGELIPAKFIQEIICTKGEEVLMTAHMSSGVSKSPFLSFIYSGAKGDVIKLSWTDNTGEAASAEATVK